MRIEMRKVCDGRVGLLYTSVASTFVVQQLGRQIHQCKLPPPPLPPKKPPRKHMLSEFIIIHDFYRIKNSVIHTNSEIPGLPIQISLDNKKTWRRLNGTMPVPDNKLIHLRTTQVLFDNKPIISQLKHSSASDLPMFKISTSFYVQFL